MSVLYSTGCTHVVLIYIYIYYNNTIFKSSLLLFEGKSMLLGMFSVMQQESSVNPDRRQLWGQEEGTLFHTWVPTSCYFTHGFVIMCPSCGGDCIASLSHLQLGLMSKTGVSGKSQLSCGTRSHMERGMLMFGEDGAAQRLKEPFCWEIILEYRILTCRQLYVNKKDLHRRQCTDKYTVTRWSTWTVGTSGGYRSEKKHHAVIY